MPDSPADLIVNPSELRHQLGLVEAQLFATVEPSVINAIDTSHDAAEAIQRLRQLGMSTRQADVVIDLPMRARSRDKRAALHAEAERLRQLIADIAVTPECLDAASSMPAPSAPGGS